MTRRRTAAGLQGVVARAGDWKSLPLRAVRAGLDAGDQASLVVGCESVGWPARPAPVIPAAWWWSNRHSGGSGVCEGIGWTLRAVTGSAGSLGRAEAASPCRACSTGRGGSGLPYRGVRVSRLAGEACPRHTCGVVVVQPPQRWFRRLRGDRLDPAGGYWVGGFFGQGGGCFSVPCVLDWTQGIRPPLVGGCESVGWPARPAPVIPAAWWWSNRHSGVPAFARGSAGPCGRLS